VEDPTSRGARVLTGGRPYTKTPLDKGFFFEPTVLVDVKDDMPVCVEEIFGPIAPILTFKTEEEVLRRANATSYGLAPISTPETSTKRARLAMAVSLSGTWRVPGMLLWELKESPPPFSLSVKPVLHLRAQPGEELGGSERINLHLEKPEGQLRRSSAKTAWLRPLGSVASRPRCQGSAMNAPLRGALDSVPGPQNFRLSGRDAEVGMKAKNSIS